MAPPLSIHISDELVLHPPHPGMAAALLEVLQKNQHHFNLFLPWAAQVNTPEKARRFLLETALFNQGGQKLILFLYFRKKLIGSAGLMRIDQQNARAEIGFWLDADWEGQGLMSQSLRALIAKAFTDLSLQRLDMRVIAQNQRAIQLTAALNFRQEGILRRAIQLNDTFHDLILFGLLRTDWQNNQDLF